MTATLVTTEFVGRKLNIKHGVRYLKAGTLIFHTNGQQTYGSSDNNPKGTFYRLEGMDPAEWPEDIRYQNFPEGA